MSSESQTQDWPGGGETDSVDADSEDTTEHDRQRREGPQNTRVAVDVLRRDQHQLLYRGDDDRVIPIRPFADGFDNRRQAIEWWQAAAVRTFGRVGEVFPASQLLADKALGTALWGEDLDRGAVHRRGRVLERLTEACELAYRDLETQATEWLADGDSGRDWTDIDPSEQKHVAMRPAFSRLDEAQAATLETLWGGFDCRSAISEWALDLPNVAKLDATLETPLMTALARDKHMLAVFLDQVDHARYHRERWAIAILLPAFAERAKRLQASERVQRTQEENPWNEVRD